MRPSIAGIKLVLRRAIKVTIISWWVSAYLKASYAMREYLVQGRSLLVEQVTTIRCRARPRFSEPPKFALYLSWGFLSCQFDSGPNIYDWKCIGNCKKNKRKNKGIHSERPANPGLTQLFLIGPSPNQVAGSQSDVSFQFPKNSFR